MKSILTIAILLSLVVSGLAQTRSVIVNTSGVVQSPTNFWSADVTNARSGLGLDTAATNPASAFQPSSSILTNLSLGNGSGLTNVTASSISSALSISNTTGLQAALDGKLATNGNTTGTAGNVTGVVALVNGGTGASNAASARTSLGATTVGGNIFTLANPDEIRFLRLNVNSSVSALTASDFRTAIGVSTGLGTVTSVGMTVPSILSLSTPTITSSGTFALTLANQSARQVFIAPSGGGIPAFRGVEPDDLPALAIAKITGLQTALDGKLATSGTATLATNVTGIVALANGGTGANSAATARTALGSTTVGSSVFTLNNPSAITFLRFNADNTATALSDSAFRSAIGLGTAATNLATAFQTSSSVLTNLAANNGSSLTNIPVAGVVGALATNGSAAGLTNFPTVALASNVTGTIAITNGGSGATTAGGARTNLGGTAVGNSVFTAINAATAATAVGLGATNEVIFEKVETKNMQIFNGTNIAIDMSDDIAEFFSLIDVRNENGISFATTNAAATTRTNLGLGWSALTNSNAGTGLVSVSTNGEVVSPTNFWQVAPIVTRFVESQPTANQTTNIAAARNLHIHSIAPSTVGITNTIGLPITGSFDGDIALVVHQGPTSSVTAVRTAGAGTNLITLNQFEEAVEFVYYDNVWQFNHNRSFIEPIFFSGTNATANAAASRTNLGLGTTNNVTFQSLDVRSLLITFTNGAITFEELSAVDATRTNMNLGKTQQVDFGSVSVNQELLLTNFSVIGNSLAINFNDGAVTGSFQFAGTNAPQFDASGAAATRTNLGLGSGITTNLVLKNGANVDTYMNFSNGILIYGSTNAP